MDFKNKFSRRLTIFVLWTKIKEKEERKKMVGKRYFFGKVFYIGNNEVLVNCILLTATMMRGMLGCRGLVTKEGTVLILHATTNCTLVIRGGIALLPDPNFA